MKKHNVEQQTPEWFALRNEHPLTASNATAIITGGKGLETLCWTATAERLSKGVVERYSNEHTDRGNELEPQARELYELETGNTVEQVGFVTNDKISKKAGCSPDGLVNDDGNLEIKCPADVKYLKMLADYKTTGTFEVEKDYYRQMQMQMLIAKRKWTDYVVYNPNFSTALLIQRIEIDKEVVKEIKEGLKKGEGILEDINNKLK